MEIHKTIETDLSDVGMWFPHDVADWIKTNSIRLGVPDQYIAIPLLVAVSYLARNTVVKYVLDLEEEERTVDEEIICAEMDLHVEPIILYGVVAGESGTNKSGSLNLISNLVDSVPNAHGVDTNHILDAFSLDGLMVAMKKNGGCALGLFDELSSFNDALDIGNKGNYERARFLSLYNGTIWQKTTKTSGDIKITSPRYNMAAFTQKSKLVKFAKENDDNGFFARFLVGCPPQRTVYMEEKKTILRRPSNLINMTRVFRKIYNRGNLILKLSSEAKDMYDSHHDDIATFKKESSGDSFAKSMKSKSLGLVMRLAAVLSEIRNALKESTSDEAPEYDEIVTELDFQRAQKIIDYSNINSLKIMNNNDQRAASSFVQSGSKRKVKTKEILLVFGVFQSCQMALHNFLGFFL